MKKQMCRLTAALLVLLVLLTGCGGYTDASTAPPSTWANYTLGSMSFQFEAGWTQEDASDLVEQMNANMIALGDTADLTVLANYVSPVGEQGTVDYLTISYVTMEEPITGEDLESIMDTLNTMAKTMKNNMAIGAEITQNARIRHYGENDALTIAFKVSYAEASSLIQTALVPSGKTLYLIAYSDFTTVKDDSTLEQILTSISFGS